jgi:hypothetical protein
VKLRLLARADQLPQLVPDHVRVRNLPVLPSATQVILAPSAETHAGRRRMLSPRLCQLPQELPVRVIWPS